MPTLAERNTFSMSLLVRQKRPQLGWRDWMEDIEEKKGSIYYRPSCALAVTDLPCHFSQLFLVPFCAPKARCACCSSYKTGHRRGSWRLRRKLHILHIAPKRNGAATMGGGRNATVSKHCCGFTLGLILWADAAGVNYLCCWVELSYWFNISTFVAHGMNMFNLSVPCMYAFIIWKKHNYLWVLWTGSFLG